MEPLRALRATPPTSTVGRGRRRPRRRGGRPRREGRSLRSPELTCQFAWPPPVVDGGGGDGAGGVGLGARTVRTPSPWSHRRRRRHRLRRRRRASARPRPRVCSWRTKACIAESQNAPERDRIRRRYSRWRRSSALRRRCGVPFVTASSAIPPFRRDFFFDRAGARQRLQRAGRGQAGGRPSMSRPGRSLTYPIRVGSSEGAVLESGRRVRCSAGPLASPLEVAPLLPLRLAGGGDRGAGVEGLGGTPLAGPAGDRT